MSKSTWLKVGGVWKEVKNVWEKVGGEWKEKVVPKINVSDVWKECIRYNLRIYFSLDTGNVGIYFYTKEDLSEQNFVYNTGKPYNILFCVDEEYIYITYYTVGAEMLKKVKISDLTEYEPSLLPTIIHPRYLITTNDWLFIMNPYDTSGPDGISKCDKLTLSEIWYIYYAKTYSYFYDFRVSPEGYSITSDTTVAIAHTPDGLTSWNIDFDEYQGICFSDTRYVYFCSKDDGYLKRKDLYAKNSTTLSSIYVGPVNNNDTRVRKIFYHGGYIYAIGYKSFRRIPANLSSVEVYIPDVGVSLSSVSYNREVAISDEGIFIKSAADDLHLLDFDGNVISTLIDCPFDFHEVENGFLNNL